MSQSAIEARPAELAEVLAWDDDDDDEFELDVRLFVTLAPLGEGGCPTDDGCGNTCQGNASSCSSMAADPS
jgi:FxLD family lantipeptide